VAWTARALPGVQTDQANGGWVNLLKCFGLQGWGQWQGMGAEDGVFVQEMKLQLANLSVLTLERCCQKQNAWQGTGVTELATLL